MLKLFFKLMYPRCPYTKEKDGTICFHQWDVDRWMVRLRRRLSWFTPHLGYGQCSSCKLPWWVGDGHTVMFSESQGCFAVCEKCWKDLSGDELWLHYSMLIRRDEHSMADLKTCKENLYQEKAGFQLAKL